MRLRSTTDTHPVFFMVLSVVVIPLLPRKGEPCAITSLQILSAMTDTHKRYRDIKKHHEHLPPPEKVSKKYWWNVPRDRDLTASQSSLSVVIWSYQLERSPLFWVLGCRYSSVSPKAELHVGNSQCQVLFQCRHLDELTSPSTALQNTWSPMTALLQVKNPKHTKNESWIPSHMG